MSQALDTWRVQQLLAFHVLIKETVPAKILELNGLIDAWRPPMTEEEQHARIMHICVPQAFRVIGLVQELECFLNSRTPKLDHGNNHGAEVLTAVLSGLSTSYTNLQSIAQNSVAMPWNRGQRQAKAKKYPDSTFVQSVSVHLLYASGHAFIGLCEIRNLLAKNHDQIVKNLDVLLAPRKEQVTNMY